MHKKEDKRRKEISKLKRKLWHKRFQISFHIKDFDDFDLFDDFDDFGLFDDFDDLWRRKSKEEI